MATGTITRQVVTTIYVDCDKGGHSAWKVSNDPDEYGCSKGECHIETTDGDDYDINITEWKTLRKVLDRYFGVQ